jgi:hypothetical protein
LGKGEGGLQSAVVRSRPARLRGLKTVGLMRPLKNVQFWLRLRKAKISTAGIYAIFRGLKFEPDTEIRQKGALCKGL